MMDKLPEIVGLVEQAESNILLKCGVSKKNFVMSALRVVIGEQEYSKQEPLISGSQPTELCQDYLLLFEQKIHQADLTRSAQN